MQPQTPSPSRSPTSFLDQVQARMGRGLPLVMSGVRGGGKAWLVAALARRLNRPLVVVTETHRNAETLHHDIAFHTGAGGARFFPPWDTIPYDSFSPQKEVMGQRLETLAALADGRCPVLVTTPQALMQGMIPLSELTRLRFGLRTGERYARADLIQRLVELGYVRVDLVETAGEFSVRGEIVDVFSIQWEQPVRLDFFDEELESIRTFDITSQKSAAPLEEVAVLPASEGILSAETAGRALQRLPDFKTRTQPETYRQFHQYLEQGTPFPGHEQLLSLLYGRAGHLHEAFPPDAVVLLDETPRLTRFAEDFHQEVLGEYAFSLEQGNLVVPSEELFLTPAQFATALGGFYTPKLLELRVEGEADTLVAPLADNQGLRALTTEGGDAHATLGGILATIRGWRNGGARILLGARSETGAERLREVLAEFDTGARVETPRPHLFTAEPLTAEGETAPELVILTATPRRGFRQIDAEGQTRFALITEEEILGEKTRPRQIRRSKLQHFIASLGELKEGDPVVHVEYGIGRYEGLQHLQVGQDEGDFLVLVYAGGDKVYIPVHRLNLVQKFTGVDGAMPALNKLGDAAWQRSKQRARRIIEDMAEDLVRIQAARKARKGFGFAPNSALMTEFSEGFPYQETEDQQRAIEDVLADMQSEAPMDRLVCGDVGFGKTEVAMRAAYLAALDDRQTMILVPTTILAQQHHETFRKRFAGVPVRVDVLSRFRKPQEQKAVARAFSAGTVDILIGTHRLLSSDVDPHALGLLVVDEEQRFGVAHKEKIKRLKAQVEVLTLSATPIPRTLHMALMGVRDLSIINTPPMDRVSVRTRVVKASEFTIREAVEREVRRGGQVFFVHNRVETIHSYGEYLRSILPHIRMAVAHGQMAEKQLEAVMMAFVNGEVDVLLSTSIVESGLDIPRANTIIINNADQFGLAQLYQLRGRVGRSNLQAYAYLLVSAEKVLTEIAQKRLTLLQELNDLGSGFRIASQDLEIRGAGNLLGREQSGHINGIGLELFTQMVEEAVTKVQGEEAPAAAPSECRLELGFPYVLPEGYIASTQQRLDLYKRLASLRSEEEVWETRQVLEDRFGRIPPEVGNLFELIRIRLLAASFGLAALERVGDRLRAEFGQAERVDVERLLALMALPDAPLQLLPDGRVLLGAMPSSPQEVLTRLRVLEDFVRPQAA